MKRFIRSNPGLRSRFSLTLDFPDFTREELGEILRRLAERAKFVISDEVSEKALNYLMVNKKLAEAEFGNARSVRACFEQMKNHLAERLFGDKDNPAASNHSALFTFLPQDVPEIPQQYKEIL